MYRIRFLVVIARCLIQAVKPINDTHSLRFRAWPLIDTDISRVFTHSYALFMALARWQLLFGSTFRAAAIKHKWVPITTAETITYKRSIRALESFKVTTQIIYWDEERFYVEHTFIANGKLCLRALVEGMIRSPAGVMKPAEVFAMAGFEGTLPIIPEALKNEIESLAASVKLTKSY